eukprot:sb/3477877/
MFVCGVGIGLFYYGVAEPVYHYTQTNRLTVNGYTPDMELAQEALTTSLYHWGLHAWCGYVVVAVTVGFVGHKKGLPLTIKSCFYPLLGDRVFGWFGDGIDTLLWW